MTAKEYLGRAFYIEDEINTKLLEIELLESSITKRTQSFGNISQSSSNENRQESKIVTYIDKVNKLNNEINCEIDTLLEVKSDIRKKINRLTNPQSRLILTKHYILLKSIKEIFEKSKYSEIKSVYNIRDQAIKEFIELHGNNF